ncbi:MAG TPA: transporter [Sphingomicrobium sp.]|nr:transporter [Sphingomicrobium sp.]
MRGRNFLITAALLCAGSGAGAADEAPICADRPGKATATCTVPNGLWQIETGLVDWTEQSTGTERDRSAVIGETILKYGITRSANVEVDVTPFQWATSQNGSVHESASGIGDVKLLFKQQLTPGDAPVQVTLLPFVKLPTAKRSLGNGKLEGGLLTPIGYSIPKTRLALALTPEVDWVADGDGHGHHVAMEQVASLGWQANDRLNLSAEIWGAWDWDPAGTTRQASADASVAYLASKDVQLDAGANFGLNRMTPDVELYTGIAIRF